MTRYRAAIVGAGGRGYPHADAYQQVPNAEVAACADPVKERREKFADRYGIKAYADAEAMITAEKPDLVHITTPPTVRVDVMRMVSDLGVPACTVEKPIALEVADWKALCALESTSKTKFAVCHQFRWYPSLAACREALASGKLGEVLFLDASAGMNIVGQGTHDLHYANFLNGDRPVVQVFGAASGWNQDDPVHPGAGTCEAYITFDNGVRMLWNTGPTAPRVGDPTTVWQHVRVAAYAEKGRVLWEEFGRWQIAGPDGTLSGDYTSMEEWWRNNLLAQAAFHKDMLTWIEDDSRPAGTHLARSLHEWKAVLALYASALERRPVELESFDPPDDLVGKLRARCAEM